MLKVKIAASLLVVFHFAALLVPTSASAGQSPAGNLKLPLTCVLYDVERGTTNPDHLTFTLVPNSANALTGTYYYGGKQLAQSTDMVAGRLPDGRLIISSAKSMFLQLKLDARTGLGILFNGFGQDVKCVSK